MVPYELARLRLPREHFDRLAGGSSDRATLDILVAGERSRRLLLLRELLDRLDRNPDAFGPLPGAGQAWDHLVAVDAANAAAVTSVLMSPQMGMWLSRMLRLLRGHAAPSSPLWVESGHLHAATFAAAVRAGRDIATRVPVRAGRAMVPTLGMATFPVSARWEWAAARVAEGIATLRLQASEVSLPGNPETDGPGWWGLRRLAPGVWLDDIDPYRDVAEPVAPARLDAAAAAHWRDMFSRAVAIVARALPATAVALSAGLLSIAPIPDDRVYGFRSASTGDAFGAALLSWPDDPVTLAVALVHEFAHIRLGGLLHLMALVDDAAAGRRVYAPWRDDPRPLSGLLQGIYAFMCIAAFWRHHRRTVTPAERDLADFEFAYARRQTRQALSTLANSGGLTPSGRDFAAGMMAELRGQLGDRVPAQTLRLAWAVAADHRAAWRIRHLEPDPDHVIRLAEAFLNGRPARGVDQVDSRLRPDRSGWPQGRLDLVRSWLRAAPRSVAVTARPVPPGASGLMRADLSLIRGDFSHAESGYRAMIVTVPGDLAAWTGLVVAVAAAGSSTSWRLLLRHPEIVRSVYQAARAGTRLPVSPMAVAEWLDAGLDRGRRRVRS
jgi:HEXXH motif-containing protein